MWCAKRRGFPGTPEAATRRHRRGKATAPAISDIAAITKRNLVIPATEVLCRSYRVRSPSFSRVRTGFRKDKDCCSSSLARSRSFLRLRSEEHTSELQSLMRISYAVFCLKKKINKTQTSY